MALKVGELFASFNLDTSGIDGAVKSAETKMSNLGKGLTIGGAAMTAAVTVPLMKAASAIYSAGTEFDAEMSKVFAIAGDSVTGSAETMDALRSKALEMGSTTQFTATEAGEAFEYMAMAGWKSEQMLSAIEPILNLAAAAGADLGTTSDIVTDAMTAFGLAADQNWKKLENGQYIDTGINNVEHFADVLAATSSNANTNVTMLGESFKYAAPVAGTLGINVEDTAVALGLMANAGIKASQAGTSLRTGLTNMVKPSKQMREAMEKYGIGLVQNADGSVNLRETMVQMRKTMAGMTETEQAAAATAIFGKHSMAGWLAIVNASDEDFNKLTGAIDGATGSAAEMKAVMLDNAKGDITIFKSAVEGLQITLWGLAENGFRKVVQQATKFVDSFRNANKSTQLGILKMAGLAAAIGPVMTGLGGVISILPKLARTFTIVSGPAALLAIGLVALGAAAIDSNNDIGKTFVTGMTKAGVKMRKFGRDVEKQLPTLTTNMSNFLHSLSTGIRSGLPGVIDGLTSVITTGVSAISANMPQIANVSQTLVRTLADSIKNNAPKIVPAVLDLLTNMATALISNIPVVLEGMGTVISSIITSVQSADWGEIGTKLKTAIENAVKEAFTVFKKGAMGDKYVEDATWAQVGAAMIENIKDGIAQAVQNSKDLLGNLVLGEDYVPDDSWGTVAGKIWNKITTEMGTLLTSAGDLIKGMVLGDDYTPDASWATVATKVWDSIKAAFATLAQNAKDLLGTIALGDDYTADTSWATIATKIWQKIKDKFTELKTNTKNLIGTLVMGSDYTADTSWGTISTKIWEKIKSKFTELKANTKDLIGTIVLGDDYTADTSWEKVGQAIWDKVKEKITSLTVDAKDLASAFGTIAGDIVTGVAGAIPTALDAAGDAFDAGLMLASSLVDVIVSAFDSFNPDLNVGGIVQSLVDNITRAIGGVFDFGGKLVTAGAHIAGSLLDSLASSLDATINTTGVSEMTGKLKTFLQTLISKIVELVPKLFQTGGKVISAGMKLASELVKSLAEGFTAGDGLDIDLAGVAKGIVDGIINAISNLPALLGDVLSAGAQIANSIMGSIADALVDTEESGVSGKLATAAVDLVHNLLTQITDFGNNPDVQGFMENLGRGFSAAMGMLGDITGKIIGYIFSVQGLTDIMNAGVSLGKLLIQGIVKGIAGIGNFIKSTIESTLVSFGVLSQEELDAAKAAGKELAQATTDAYNDAANGEIELTGGEESFINWANYFGGQNRSELDTAATDLVHLFDGAIGAAAERSNSGEEFRDTLLSNLFWGNEDWLMAAFEKGINLDDANLDLTKVLPEIGVNLADILPKFDDLDFWGSLLEAVTSGNKADVMSLITGMIQEAAAEAVTETEQAAAEAAESSSAVPEEVAEAWSGLPDNVKQAAATVNEETGNFLKNLDESDAGAQFATTITENMGQAETAATEAANAVATEVLLTLSAENGSIMAEAFLGGLIAAFNDDGVLIMAASVMAVKTHDAVQQVLTYASSFRIGKNFGQGLVNGINSMISAVTTAAANLGAAAAGALSGAIQEGSPSKLTAETGRNFGLGFINSIMASVDDAGNAAAMVGMSAASSLEQTISEISGDAADQMSIPGNGRRSEAETLAAENEKTAQTYASAIAQALSGAKVMMNGTLVGELVTDTVSEGIASRYAGMRYGTV